MTFHKSKSAGSLKNKRLQLLVFETNYNYCQIFEANKPEAFNPLFAATAIWQFAIITQTAVCIIPLDVFLYPFQYPVHLF